MTLPGTQTTLASSNTAGTISPGFGSTASLNAHTTTTATTIGTPAMAFGYPKAQGIAIKYTN